MVSIRLQPRRFFPLTPKIKGSVTHFTSGNKKLFYQPNKVISTALEKNKKTTAPLNFFFPEWKPLNQKVHIKLFYMMKGGCEFFHMH
jgi:hypothetical protein